MNDLLTLALLAGGAYLFLKKPEAPEIPIGPISQVVPTLPEQIAIDSGLPPQASDMIAAQSGAIAVGSLPAANPAMVQSVVESPEIQPPGPVILENLPSTDIAAYGGVMSPAVGATFQGTNEGVQAAQDYTNAGYLSDIAEPMATGDIPWFLSLYFTIYDPDVNPLVYQQNIGTPGGKAVYDYYNRIAASVPGLTKAGMMEYFSLNDIYRWQSVSEMMNWARVAYADPTGNKDQIVSWFTDPSFFTAPFVSPDVTWKMTTGFLNHLGEPYEEGVDTYAYWQETSGDWFRADLQKNVINLYGPPPWLQPRTPFGGGPGSY